MKWLRAFIIIYGSLMLKSYAQNCRQRCPNNVDPICGSDGNTYDNSCLLDLSSCEKNKKIFMVHKGRCNPCNTYECTSPPNSRCVVDVNGLPTCVCTFRCYQAKREVCGSDGQTYKNKCEMQKNSCNEKTLIRVANVGRCGQRGACSRIKCPGTSICKLVRGRAKCVGRTRCKLSCPRIYRPVCGTNAKTYSNKCVLERFTCIKHSDVVVSYKGRCRVARGACRRKECPKGMYCQLKTRQARCVRACRKFCPRVYHPVCGDDGRTYSSKCELEREACETNTKIAIKLLRRCKDSKFGCENIKCGPYATCKNIFGTPKCYKKVCKRWCARVYRPVCASDGKTYPNECEMQMQSCRNRKIVKKIRNGRCGNVGCQITTCMRSKKPYSFCKVIDKKPTCVCKESCQATRPPVCGTDQKTYDSTCHLEMISCKAEEKITVVHEGKCGDTCETKNCSSLPYSECAENDGLAFCMCPNCNNIRDLVCGSDGVTYTNLCLMKRYSCYNKKRVDFDRKGNCSEPTTPTCMPTNCTEEPYSSCEIIKKRPTCSCPKNCKKILEPVCGSDGKTYPNTCILEKISCESRMLISVKAKGKCREIQTTSKHETCSPKNCSQSRPYATCKKINNTLTCSCHISCTQIQKPVCGSDDKSYPNACILERISCEQRKEVSIKSNGKCTGNLQSTTKSSTLKPQKTTTSKPRTYQLQTSTTHGNIQQNKINHTEESKVDTIATSEPSTTIKPNLSTAALLNTTHEPTQGYKNQHTSRPITQPITDRKLLTSSIQVTSHEPMKQSTQRRRQNQPNLILSHTKKDKTTTSFSTTTKPTIFSTTKLQYNPSPITSHPLLTKQPTTLLPTTKLQRSTKQKTKRTFVPTHEPLISQHTVQKPSTKQHLPEKTTTTFLPTTKFQTTKKLTTRRTFSVLTLPSTSHQTIQVQSTKPNYQKQPTTNKHQTTTKITTGRTLSTTSRPLVVKQTTQQSTKLHEKIDSSTSLPTESQKLIAPTTRSTYKHETGKTKMTEIPTTLSKTEPSETCIEDSCQALPYSKCKIVDRKQTCICPSECERKKARPICGSDDETYNNVCFMERASCQKKTKVTIKAFGTCKDLQCELCYTRPYARCLTLKGSSKPICACPSKCSRRFEPVCGSDGNSYFNDCEMKKMSCMKKAKITVANKGFCENICLKKDCTIELPYSSCKVINNRPRCLCQPFCGGKHDPVCGSDNITYPNDCMMRKTSCETASWISVKHKGVCVDTKAFAQPFESPCYRKNCSSVPYSACKVIDGKATCQCSDRCNTTLDPVCGSDDATYLNECLLKVTSCKGGGLVTIKNKGYCQDKCTNFKCKFYAKCYIREKKPTCICPRRQFCSNSRIPVCGSDGKMYTNKCIMRSVSCAMKTSIKPMESTKHCAGQRCQPWSGCSFPPYSRCMFYRGSFSCVCPRFCRSTFSPVCGSDGRIYGNICTLQKYSCLGRRSIKQVSIQECDTTTKCEKVVCQKRQICKVVSNKARCISRFCVQRCPSLRRPVCGSDNKTYKNNCELRRKACTENTRISRMSFGACQ